MAIKEAAKQTREIKRAVAKKLSGQALVDAVSNPSLTALSLLQQTSAKEGDEKLLALYESNEFEAFGKSARRTLRDALGAAMFAELERSDLLKELISKLTAFKALR